MKDYIIKDFRRQIKKNTVLLLVIAFAISILMGMLILEDTMTERILCLTEKAGVDNRIMFSSKEFFDEMTIQQIQNTEGVLSLDAQTEYFTEGRLNQNKRGVWLIGVSEGFEEAENLKVVDGKSINFGSDDIGVLVDYKVSQKEGITVGDKITVSLINDDVICTVVGIYRKNRITMQPVYEFYVKEDTLKTFIGRHGLYNRGIVRLEKNGFEITSRTEETIKEIIGKDTEVDTMLDIKANAKKDLKSFTMLLTGIFVIILLGSVYFIYSSFVLRMEKRRKELAIIKLLGAKDKQIKRALIREGALIGAFGGLLGAALGIMTGLVFCFFYANWDYTEIVGYYTVNPFYLAICVVLGVAVCCLGSLKPIKRAAGLSPITELKNITSQQYKKPMNSKLPLKFYSGILVFILVMVLSSFVRDIDNTGLIYGCMIILGVLMVTALLLMIPYVIFLFGKAVTAHSTHNNRADTFLAAQNMENYRNSSDVVIKIIVIGISIIVSLHGMFSSAKESVAEYASKAFFCDYLVGYDPREYPDTDALYKKIDETGMVNDYTEISVYNYEDRKDGNIIRIFGIDPKRYDDYSALELISEEDICFSDLEKQKNSCFVSNQIMFENDYKLGDTIKYINGEEVVEFVIMARFNSFTNDGRLVFMNTESLERISNESDSRMLCINIVPGVSGEEFEKVMSDMIETDSVSVESVYDLGYTWKNDVVKGTEILYLVFYLISFVILFSICNNVISSVIQRKNEIGTFFSIGAGEKAIKRMFSVEVLFQLFIALIVGYIGSYGLLYVFVKCISAVFHAELSVYYPYEIVFMAIAIMLIIFFVSKSIIITRLLKSDRLQLIKDRSA